MSFRLKQIGLSLCLIASLLVGSASACACAHHQETEKAEEISCHGSGHEKPDVVEVPAGTPAFDADCLCLVAQPAPVIVSKSETKKTKAASETAETPKVSLAKFISVSSANSPPPETVRHFARSRILESLLPARAPPRL